MWEISEINKKRNTSEWFYISKWNDLLMLVGASTYNLFPVQVNLQGGEAVCAAQVRVS